MNPMWDMHNRTTEKDILKMDMVAVRNRLMEHEGIELKPYRCTSDKLTIGVGRNIEDRGISMETAMQMLDEDIDIVMDELQKAVPGWEDMPSNFREALVDLAFNMGVPRLMQFKKMLASLAAGDGDNGAVELLDSRYANQVGKRAHNIAALLRAS